MQGNMSMIELSGCEWQVKRSKGVFSRCQCSNFFMGNISVWGELSRPIRIAREREEGRKAANRSLQSFGFVGKKSMYETTLSLGVSQSKENFLGVYVL